MIIVAVCSAANVALAKPLLDDIFANKDKQVLMQTALIILGVTSIKAIAEYFENYLVKSLGQKILTDLQILLFNHLLDADLAFLQKESSGKLISRFTNDISLMRGAVSNLLIGISRYLFTVIGLVVIMFSLEPKLSMIVFIAFPLAIYPIQLIGKRMRKIVHQTQDKLGDYTAKLDEVFLSIKVVKSYQGEDMEAKKAKQITDEILRLYKKAVRLDSLTSPITEFLSGLAVASILVYGGLSVINGESTAGSLIAFIAAFFSAYRPFKSLLVLNVNLQEGLAASKRLFVTLDTKPVVFDSPSSKALNIKNTNISFQNVSLKLSDKEIFQDISLEIPANKTTAIVGESGSGKSSLINLLLKFYLPDSGKILIGDQDIANVKTKSLRNQIALVTQETLLFDTSISENIAYTSHCSQNEIVEAAKKSSCNEFIRMLPQGYDTTIGFQGYSLSGGQKQRLSLARAFAKKAPILVLDEATSSLDAHNESMVFGSLKTEVEKITTIIVTHKLSSIKNADNIIVIEQGKLLEQGTHEELISKRGKYFDLYQKQTHSEEAKNEDII
jgi:subfamily B ATP-binding cassette protein MsbA